MSISRVRASLVVGLLIVAAVLAVAVALIRDTQAGAAAREGCRTEVDLKLPVEAAEVTIRVLNGTGDAGVADRVTEDFQDRGFQVQPAVTSKEWVSEVAVVRYGPRAVGAAHWIRAHFLDEAEPQFTSERTTEVIDVVIGDRFQQLATRIEVNQALAQLSRPEPPPGTC